MSSVTHSSFVIERRYPVIPERVFAAFADPVRKRGWFAEDEGMNLLDFETDFRVGGRERTRSRFAEGTPFPGATLTNETWYLDIVPDRRIVTAYTMILGEKRISASLATVELLPAERETVFIFTDQGAYFEGADGPQMREEGWRKLLDKLAQELIKK